MLKKYIETLNAKKAEMAALVQGCETETRAMTDDENAKFDALEKEIESLKATIAKLEKAAEMTVPEETPAEEEQTEERSTTEEDADMKDFADMVRGNVLEKRAETNFTTDAGASVVPRTIAQKVIARVKEISPIVEMSDYYNVKGDLSIPYYDETESKITVAYATEFEDVVSTSGKFKSIDLKGFLASALCKVSKSLVNNSDFDIVSFVVERMAMAIAEFMEQETLNGTSGKITGLSTLANTVDAASATAITVDDLIETQEAVADLYQEGAIWIMSHSTRVAIRKLKDNDGNLILNKDATAQWGYTLFGKPVYTSDAMSDIASGKKAVYYVNPKQGVAVKMSEEMNIEVLREKFATQHALGVIASIEVDVKVENEQAVAALKMA